MRWRTQAGGASSLSIARVYPDGSLWRWRVIALDGGQGAFFTQARARRAARRELVRLGRSMVAAGGGQ